MIALCIVVGTCVAVGLFYLGLWAYYTYQKTSWNKDREKTTREIYRGRN